MDYSKLNYYIDLFKDYVLIGDIDNEISLAKDKTDGKYCDEFYKNEIAKRAYKEIHSIAWETVTDEKACNTVIQAVNYSQNLIFRNIRADFIESVKSKSSDYAEVFRRLYGDDGVESDSCCFKDLTSLFGAKYGILAYLFFIKNPNRYLPVSPEKFDAILPLIGINHTMSHKCSWKNYNTFLEIVNDVKNRIISRLGYNISLLDTHSFLWILNTIDSISLQLETSENYSCVPPNFDLNLPEFSGVPIPKDNPSKRNSKEKYTGKPARKYAALKSADFKCEFDENHISFIRKSDGNNYTEGHHLIPLCYSDDYNNSLDNVANIVSLCSNCHNQIHYGRDKKEIIKKLYEKRKDKLKDAGIAIEIEKLLECYET